jgi:hypothetical protein
MPIADKIPLSRLLAYGAGGVGLAALENRYIGNNLPPELKTVNGVIGATTGAMLASHNPAMQTAALGSIPLKEMALFGIGGMDRFRRAQQGLVDTNLQTARLNQDTARTTANDASSRKAMALAFLLPALAVGGGVAANSYMNWKKQHHKTNPRFQTLASSGKPRSSQRIRLDIPPSALPRSFFQSLGRATNDPRDYTRLQGKDNEMTVQASEKAPSVTMPEVVKQLKDEQKHLPLVKGKRAEILKQAYDSGQRPSLARTLGGLAWGATGIPMAQNAWREAGYGLNTLQQGDYHDAKRYGMSSAANAALALIALRFNMPLAAKLFGKARIGGVLRNDMARQGLARFNPLGKGQWSEFPTAARFANKWGLGHQLGPTHLSPDAPMQGFTSAPGGYITGADRMARRSALGLNTRSPINRALDIHGAYDPQRYAWSNPTTSNPLFRKLLSTGDPKTLPGHAINLLRYGANRGVNAMYAGKQFMKRWPNLTGSLALPAVGAVGVEADRYQQEQERGNQPGFLDSSRNAPSGNYMPASTMFGNMIGAFGGGGPMQPLRAQLGG